MSRIIYQERFQNVCFLSGILLMLLALIFHPTEAVAAAKSGVELSLNVILPSLFPFFVLSTLCIRLNLLKSLDRMLGKLMMPLFHLRGSCSGAYLLGIIGGYPVGARTAIELYRSGKCTKAEAERMLSFCNNSGPAFILGVVSTGVFSSSGIGLWLYGAHVTASILVGILFRNHNYHGPSVPTLEPQRNESVSFSAAFTDAVKSAFSSTGNICAFVIFFTVVIRLLFLAGIFEKAATLISLVPWTRNIDSKMIEATLSGLIEMTSGVWNLRDAAAGLGSKLCMAAFILGWAGLSVHCQVLSFIGSSGLSTKTYFLGKLLHGVLSGSLIFLLSKLLGWKEPISQYLATEVTALARMDFHSAFFVSLSVATGLWLILNLLFHLLHRNFSGNTKKNRV